MDAKSPNKRSRRVLSKGEQTRHHIVVAAAPLFNQLGFAGCSMQDIQAASGLEKGGLYRHFESKEELAAEALRYSIEAVRRERFVIPGSITGAIDRLRFLVHQFVHIPSPIPGGCPLLNTAIDADDGNPVLRSLALSAFREWRQQLERIVTAGMEAGELRTDIAPGPLASLLISTLEGALVLSRLERSRTPLLECQAQLEPILTGLAAKPRRARRNGVPPRHRTAPSL